MEILLLLYFSGTIFFSVTLLTSIVFIIIPNLVIWKLTSTEIFIFFQFI